MKFSDYQAAARATAIYPLQAAVTYPLFGLCGEVGELANKYKKVIRDDGGKLSDEKRAQLLDELGDIVWYVAALVSDLGGSLEEVAFNNIQKLRSRHERGVIQGDGDNR